MEGERMVLAFYLRPIFCSDYLAKTTGGRTTQTPNRKRVPQSETYTFRYFLSYFLCALENYSRV